MQNSAWKLGRGDTGLARFCELHAINCPREYMDFSIREALETLHIKVSILSQLNGRDSGFYDTTHWNNSDDIIIWKGSSDGTFSVKSFYQSFATRHSTVLWAKCIWLKWIPPRVSLLMWRVLLNGLPTEDNIRRLGIPFPSRCLCCNSSEETLEHILFKGSWAGDLWRFIQKLLGTHIPTGFNMFKRCWVDMFNEKNYFHCFCIGLVCTGMWELWNRRNAAMHEDKSFHFIQRMHVWVSKLSDIIPAGFMSRNEELIIDQIKNKRTYIQKPAWIRWLPDIPGNWMHIALVPDGEAFRGSSLIRDPQGVFLFGMVLSIPKTRSVCEFIQMVESALNMADQAQLRVRHIISSHESSFPYKTNHEGKVPWEFITRVRQLDSTYGPLNFHSIPASLNNAALCLAYKGVSMSQTRNSSDLPFAVRCCITVEQLGLPVLSGEVPSIVDYPGGRSADDSSPALRSPGGRAEDNGIWSTRRTRDFSDDMSLDT